MVFAREGQVADGVPAKPNTVTLAGALGARRGRHVAQRHLRKGSAEHISAGREEEVLPAPPRGTECRRPVEAGAGLATGSSPRTASNGRFVSYYGDNHPRFAGNVVKAMASAKDGYSEGRRALRGRTCPASIPPARRSAIAPGSDLGNRLDAEFNAVVEDVVRLTPTIVEVIVRAPAAARHFEPGQFYRLQNFETLAPRVQRRRRDDAAADGRHRADRRVGGQGAEACSR